MAHPEVPAVHDANTSLTAEELAELGSQAVQIIASSPKPLTTLIHLAQNFPKYATSLSRRVVTNSSVADELQSNSLKVSKDISMFWLNGLQIDAKDVNPFGLLRLLKKEREVMNALVSRGMTRGQAFELLTHPEFANRQENTGLDAIFDASDRLEGANIIVWWNDIEKDSRYVSFILEISE
jgi:UDP-glucose:glycoprotein glucosyltransferase